MRTLAVRFLILVLFLAAAAAGPSAAGDAILEEEELLFDADMGDGPDTETDPDPPPEGQAPKETGSVAGHVLDNSTFFLGWRGSMRTGDDPELINNHLFFRHTMASLFAENWFYRLDWRARLFPESDHRADDADEAVDWDAHVREAYVLSGRQNFSVRLGSQINVWGKADTAAVTDVLSPRDASEFIFYKLEDARFGQVMASADLFMERAGLFLFFSPLPAVDRLPDPGTHYYRPPAGPAGISYLLDEEKPEFGDVEAGFKLDRRFSRTEVSVMAGRFFANAPVFTDQGPAGPDARQITRVYPDYLMGGAAMDHPSGNFIFKLELAYKSDFPLQGITAGGLYREVPANLLDGAAGIEYDANQAWQASLEISNRRILSSTDGIVRGIRDSTALYFTYIRDFFHEVLELEYNYYHHFQDSNRFHNVQLTWDLTDAVQIRARYTWFDITEPLSLMWAYKDEDRAALEIRYAF